MDPFVIGLTALPRMSPAYDLGCVWVLLRPYAWLGDLAVPFPCRALDTPTVHRALLSTGVELPYCRSCRHA